MIGCLSFALERLGLYKPQLKLEEARNRLSLESQLWKKFQRDRSEFWNNFQADNKTTGQLHSLVEGAMIHFESHNIQRIAVDLGCGINTTTFNLLERGWKVYAIDSSEFVIKTLAEKVSSMGKSWIQDGQLVLVNQTIEEFKFPEKVHLVTAYESLPYCNPEQINKIFLKIKDALLPQGILVCNLYPYHPIADNVLREMFGAWMTTKNVVEAVVKSVNFSKWSVTEGMSPGGIVKQFHIFAQEGS